jgi:glycosyltransferase EpsE
MVRVSVIMAVYNPRQYLKAAVDSILKQKFKDFEFIIIDDCSTDGSGKILDRYAKKDKRIKLIRNKENLGLTKNLNKGIKLARGEYIARMDADDISLPNRFAVQVKYLDDHPKIDLIGSWADVINNKDKKISELKYAPAHEQIKRHTVGRSQFIHPTVMFRKSIVKKVGYYDETFRSAQDYEYFPRVMTKCRVANIPKKLLLYRWDFGQNEGFTKSKRQEKNALRARWRMITRFGWPKWHFVYMIKPLISYCIPSPIKKVLIKMLYARK